MKIKLIGPTRYLENGKLLKSKKLMIPSLTFPLLAALTPPDIDVSIVNEICEDINFEEKVDLVGITSYTINIHRAYQIADQFRKRNVPVVMGGIHVSMEPEEAKKHADTIIVGEAEETWPQFINDIRNGKRKKFYKAEKRPSLANLPIPRFLLINKSHYVDYQLIPIQTARGCPHSCDFCSVTRFSGRRYRPRPISDVINEIKSLGAKNCFFIDDNIFASPSRARELLKELIPLRILWIGQATISAAEDRELIELAQKSGCIELAVGLESLSRKNLKSVRKTMNKVEHYEKNLKTYRELGIRVAASMIFGFDDDESGVFKETYHFLMKNRLPYTYWTALCPYPETPLYKRLKDQGRLKDAKWWLNRNRRIYGLEFTGIKMKEEVFSKNLYRYYRRFYSIRSIITRALFPPQRRWLPTIYLNLAYRKRITRQAGVFEH